MLKWFKFEIKKDERKRVVSISSKHLNGAVKKLYQTCEFDEVIRIL